MRRVVVRGDSPSGAAPRREPRRGAGTAPATTTGIAGDLVDIVDALPNAILWSLLGIATIALGLAGNAFHHSRRRTALEAQQLELIDDIGLLSRRCSRRCPSSKG